MDELTLAILAVSYSTKVIKSKQITTKSIAIIIETKLYPIVQK